MTSSKKPAKEVSDTWITRNLNADLLTIALFVKGNGLMDEKEFRTWIMRIQALRDETSAASSSSSKTATQSELEDDASQDLVAAFRLVVNPKSRLSFASKKLTCCSNVYLDKS